ncbi:MAG: phytanoyl-CoA dioxygenase family protein [Pirellulaceae bacterium]
MIIKDPVVYSDIDTRGFVLIRSFLDDEQIAMLHEDFNTATLEVNSNYSVRRISNEATARLEESLQAVNRDVAANSSVNVDLMNDGVYFATYSEKSTLTSIRPGPQQFPWHQDHENYWMWYDTTQYLNFYIPIVKPVSEKSNLAVVPFDRLKERAPEVYEKLLGRGATRVLKSGRKWVVKDDDRGGNVGKLDFDPEEIEEIPHLSPGDLLLLRGDVIHRTQDSSTRRIAASIRYISSKTMVPRTMLTRGGPAKALMMFNARYLFEPAFRCFDQSNANAVSAGVLDEYMKQIRNRRLQGEEAANVGRIAFLARLMKEKVRGRLVRQS